VRHGEYLLPNIQKSKFEVKKKFNIVSDVTRLVGYRTTKQRLACLRIDFWTFAVDACGEMREELRG